MSALKELGLSDSATERVGTFSTGQRRSVALAGARVRLETDSLKLLLLDEPAAGLDVDRVEILEAFLADATSRGCAVLLAEHVGSRLHVCHVSTAGSVEIIRWAKSRGIDVTAEATPHHLLLSEDLAETYDPVYKVNPPLRSRADVEALREGLADGTIDIVGTDHAPHPMEDKECEWAVAAFGMLGLEQALAVVIETMVSTGRLDWAGVADRMSIAPARIGRRDGHGRPIAVGEPANLVLVDPDARRPVDPARSASKSRNNPYRGVDLPDPVVATFLRGRATVLDRALVGPA